MFYFDDRLETTEAFNSRTNIDITIFFLYKTNHVTLLVFFLETLSLGWIKQYD